MVREKTFMATLVGFFMLCVSAQALAQSDVIEQRQKLMKSNSASAKAINGAAKSKDYATIETKAKVIMGNADKIVGLFPKGSTEGKTRATAKIWDNFDKFSENPKKLKQAASDIAAAAAAKDDAAIQTKVKELGNVCSSCHKEFRAKEYPK